MVANTNGDSGNDNRAAPPTFDNVRDVIVQELRAEGLPQAEQDKLIFGVGQALLERATLALMRAAPPELIIEFGEDGKDPQDPANAQLFMQRVMERIPNAQDVITDAVKAGLRDYQEYLDKELAQSPVK